MITVSAPGKLFLLGEHAVVYGYPCLVAAVDMRLTVTVAKKETGATTIQALDSPDTTIIDAALMHAKNAWGIDNAFDITTQSGFSGKYGFGSSAAVMVATLYAIAGEMKKNLSKDEVFREAFAAMKTVQPQASGADIAAAIWGGVLLYGQKGEAIEQLSVSQTLPCIVAYSGEKANTPEVVADVAQKREQYPQKVEKIFEAMSQLVLQGRQAIEAGEWERVGVTMNFAQEYLRDLGVSSDTLEALIRAAKGAGAFGVKLSGAGRGDCVIAVALEEKRKSVIDALARAGGEVVPVGMGAEGVRVEL